MNAKANLLVLSIFLLGCSRPLLFNVTVVDRKHTEAWTETRIGDDAASETVTVNAVNHPERWEVCYEGKTAEGKLTTRWSKVPYARYRNLPIGTEIECVGPHGPQAAPPAERTDP